MDLTTSCRVYWLDLPWFGYLLKPCRLLFGEVRLLLIVVIIGVATVAVVSSWGCSAHPWRLALPELSLCSCSQLAYVPCLRNGTGGSCEVCVASLPAGAAWIVLEAFASWDKNCRGSNRFSRWKLWRLLSPLMVWMVVTPSPLFALLAMVVVRRRGRGALSLPSIVASSGVNTL